MAPPKDYSTKLDWAKEHLEALYREVQTFVQGQPYRLITEFDPKTRENVVRLKSSKESLALDMFLFNCTPVEFVSMPSD